MRSVARTALACLAVFLGSAVALAQEPVLTITDGNQTVELSRDDLAQMEQDVIETSSKWIEGVNKFSGPTMTDVLEKAGFAGETVNAEATDKYSLDVPRSHLTGDGAILAISMNDEPLPEDQAPFWIIFPYDQNPETNDEDHQSWSVYKLAKLTVKP
jgi:hypothetical protein